MPLVIAYVHAPVFRPITYNTPVGCPSKVLRICSLLVTTLSTAFRYVSNANCIGSGVLTFVLSRSKTGFDHTDSIINRLIRGAIQTGLFASIFALGDLFAFVFLRNTTTFYAMFAYPIGRIYTNVSGIHIRPQ